jgi:hypothetical protein
MTVGSSSLDWVGYVVGSHEVMLATSDTPSAGHPIVGGEAISSGTALNMASLANSHMFHISGVSSGKADVSIGSLTFDGIGSFTGTEFEDQSGTLGNASLSGNYIVDSGTGRTVFQTSQQGQNLGAHPFVAYIIPVPSSLSRTSCSANQASCVTGFLVGIDSSAQDGILEFQTPTVAPPPPFINQFVTGDYVFGTDQALTAGTPTLEGDAYAAVNNNSTTSGTLKGLGGGPILQDVAFGDPSYCLQSGCYLLLSGEALTGTYSVSTNGTGSFGNGKVSVTNGRVVFYIDESSLSLDQGSTVLDPQPSIVVAEQ